MLKPDLRLQYWSERHFKQQRPHSLNPISAILGSGGMGLGQVGIALDVAR